MQQTYGFRTTGEKNFKEVYEIAYFLFSSFQKKLNLENRSVQNLLKTEAPNQVLLVAFLPRYDSAKLTQSIRNPDFD